jgi:chromosome segregation ATPase
LTVIVQKACSSCIIGANQVNKMYRTDRPTSVDRCIERKMNISNLAQIERDIQTLEMKYSSQTAEQESTCFQQIRALRQENATLLQQLSNTKDSKSMLTYSNTIFSQRLTEMSMQLEKLTNHFHDMQSKREQDHVTIESCKTKIEHLCEVLQETY